MTSPGRSQCQPEGVGRSGVVMFKPRRGRRGRPSTILALSRFMANDIVPSHLCLCFQFQGGLLPLRILLRHLLLDLAETAVDLVKVDGFGW